MEPRRQRLVPGLRVVTCGRESVQIGLESTHSVRLPGSPATRSALERLTVGAPLGEDPALLDVADQLGASGHLVDSTLVVTTTDLAALALADPSRFAERQDRRRKARVAVTGTLGPDPTPLLSAAGLTCCAPEAADVVLVAKVGEIDRAWLDPLVVRQVPHVVVRLLDGVGIVGPFVEPGRSACLRCIDAHLGEDEPFQVELVQRYARATDQPRADGGPEPVDTALATLALAWAVRDVISHVDGLRPSSWSSTIRLDPTLTDVTSASWLRHPECSCSWADPEAGQGFPV